MTLALLITAASALFPPHLPEPERVKQLSKFFDPAPGEEILLNEEEVRQQGLKTKPENFRGFIKVSPPPGVCFTITRTVDQPDDYVCKPKSMSFRLVDLDRAGRLGWRVATGDDDFGTDLHWRSRYRTGIVMPFNIPDEDPPVYQFISKCTIDRTPHGRRMRIGMLTGETWIVAFPDQHTLEPQPKPIPNLFMNVSSGKVSVKDAAKQKEAEAAKKGAAEAGAPAPEHGAAPSEEPAKPKEVAAPSQDDDRAIWAIPARNAYTMKGNAFMPHGSVPPGGKGRCRYNFQGPNEDPETGRLECHDVDGFKNILLPLTCLRDLR